MDDFIGTGATAASLSGLGTERPGPRGGLSRERNALLVETQELTKCYGIVTALDHCTLGVHPGEVFGLLGPNGSGKTTLIRLLLGFLKPTAGTAQIAGLDCQRQSLEVRQRTAYLPGDARLFPNMNGHDILRFFADVRSDGNLEHANEIAEQLELDLTRRVAFMSTGMRQKLALSACLSSGADLLILDEPTANLDPTVRGNVLRLIQAAQQSGKTIIFSSHVLSEIEEVCQRVVILRHGRLVHELKMSDLKLEHRIHATLAGEVPPVPAELRDRLRLEQREASLTIHASGDLASVLGWLAGLPLASVQIEPLGLRSVYDRFHPGLETEG